MSEPIKKKISVVVPCYNEESNLRELQKQVVAAFARIPQYDFEVILVDNGSKDGTWEKSLEIRAEDDRFKCLRLSKNFTAPGGITAGLRYATGDAAIVMCADLQDPPDKIPDFVAKWEEGYDVVYQVVSERRGVSFMRSWASNLFHSLMTALTQNNFPKNGTVYRLMDVRVYEAFNLLNESNRYFPGLCSWIGFNSYALEFPRVERFAGKSHASLKVVLTLAFNGIFAFSYLPLRMMTWLGLAIATSSFGYLVYLTLTIFFTGRKAMPGIATQIALMLFMFGILFLFIGIIGEYVGRIYDEVKRRPLFIVKEQLGLRSRVRGA